MARVIIPSPLRKFTDNQREVVIQAQHLSAIIDGLLNRYQGLNEVIHGHPALLNVFINGKLVQSSRDQWDKVMLKDDDEVSLIIPIAGG